MTDSSKTAKVRQRKPEGPFSDELLDQILSQLKGNDAESLLGQTGLVAQLKKQLAERMLSAELGHHLRQEREQAEQDDPVNHRNGSTGKTVLTEDGPLRIDVPRDRQGSFEPLLIPKHERRFTGYGDLVGALARA